MLSVRGIYTGTEIKPLEAIRMRPNVRVIITFLEDEPSVQRDKGTQNLSTDSHHLTRLFLEKCGGWEDTRRPEEIIADIYASRTASERGSRLFQEDEA